MNVSSNREVARALFERFFDGRQLGLIEALATPDFIDHSPHSQQPAGPAGLVWLNGMLHEICPNLRFEIDDLIGEDDTVAVRYTMSGTLEDGDPLEEHAIALFRFRDGRICERWAGLMR
jgi:predicted SnoaL-like aldol condensation-catalyzing enzyme